MSIAAPTAQPTGRAWSCCPVRLEQQPLASAVADDPGGTRRQQRGDTDRRQRVGRVLEGAVGSLEAGNHDGGARRQRGRGGTMRGDGAGLGPRVGVQREEPRRIRHRDQAVHPAREPEVLAHLQRRPPAPRARIASGVPSDDPLSRTSTRQIAALLAVEHAPQRVNRQRCGVVGDDPDVNARTPPPSSKSRKYVSGRTLVRLGRVGWSVTGRGCGGAAMPWPSPRSRGGRRRARRASAPRASPG